MRVLVATDFLELWTGSEIVALEVAEHFDAVFTSYWAEEPALSQVKNWQPVEAIKLEDFDFVWAQHHVLLSLLDRITSDQRPYTVWATLSPYEDMEQIPPSLLNEYVDVIAANSRETSKARGAHISFDNAAPREFHFTREQRDLSNILFVSNNQPREMVEAAAILKSKGYSLRFLGRGKEYRRTRPEDIAWADCVVTIGKTAQYALASGTPLFIYDRFGGDGYVTEENYALNSDFNFSGRPHERRLDAAALAEEIITEHRYRALPEQPVLNDVLDQLASKATPQPFKRIDDLGASAAMANCIGRWMVSCRKESVLQWNIQGYGRTLRHFAAQKAPGWIKRLSRR